MLGVACRYVKSEIHRVIVGPAVCQMLATSAFTGFSPILLLTMHV